MSEYFAVGQRVRVVGHGGFGDGVIGTIAKPDPFILEHAEPNEWRGHVGTIAARRGLLNIYYVVFDEPADDGSGDGPYQGAVLAEDHLAPIE